MHLLNDQEIKKLAIFSELTPDEWAQVYPLLNHTWVIEGEQLIQAGARANTLYILLNGHFMIHFKGGRAVTVNRKGDIMGWSSVISPYQYTADVIALTKGDVLSIPGSRFLELLQGNAALGEKLSKKINENIHRRRLIAQMGPVA